MTGQRPENDVPVVMVLAAACPRLTTLSIASMKRLTDAAISAVAAGCPRLERLEANMCTRLTG